MLVARVDRPGTRLVLGHAPGPPRIDQTTMLRVILPLKPAGQESGCVKRTAVFDIIWCRITHPTKTRPAR